MMKLVSVLLLFAAVGVQSSEAACVKPSGRYVGSGAGVDYRNSDVYSYGALQMSINIPSSGQWSADVWGIGAGGRFAEKFVVRPTGTVSNTFDLTTCRGEFSAQIAGKRGTFSYVVSGTGSAIEIVYTKEETNGSVSPWVIALRRT